MSVGGSGFLQKWVGSVIKFDAAGTQLKMFGHPKDERRHDNDSDDDKLMQPRGIAITRDGQVLACDHETGVILAFPSPSTHHEDDLIGSIRIRTRLPNGIAVDRNGQILVTSTALHSVELYDSQYQRVGSFGHEGTEPGAFKWPSAVATDSADRIIVSDRSNNRVEIFDRDGGFLAEIGKGHLESPTSVCVDTRDNIIVGDLKGVHVFTRDGNYQRSFDIRGVTGLALSGEILYVCNLRNLNSLKYQPA